MRGTLPEGYLAHAEIRLLPRAVPLRGGAENRALAHARAFAEGA